jgi:hypothetical protein
MRLFLVLEGFYSLFAVGGLDFVVLMVPLARAEVVDVKDSVKKGGGALGLIYN